MYNISVSDSTTTVEGIYIVSPYNPSTTTILLASDLSVSSEDIGQNLLLNGNFEIAPPSSIATTAAGVYINGYAAGAASNPGYGGYKTGSTTSNASALFDTSQAHSGNYSMNLSTLSSAGTVSVGSADPSSLVTLQATAIRVQPGVTYNIIAYCMTNNVPTNGAFIQTFEYSQSGGSSTQTTSNKLSGTNGWTQLTITVTTQITTAYMLIELRNNVTGTVGTAWFDDITVIGTGNVQIQVGINVAPSNPAYTIPGVKIV